MTTTPTTQIHSVTVSHTGGSLHITDHPGEEPAVVAMHGFPDDHHIYDRLIPHLDGGASLPSTGSAGAPTGPLPRASTPPTASTT